MFVVDAQSTAPLERRLRDISREFTDDRLAVLLEEIGTVLDGDIQNGVDDETDLDGVPWPTLSRVTAEARRRGASGETTRGYDHMLRDFGMMMGSVTHEVVGDTLLVGILNNKTEAAKGAAHNEGIGVPQREWLGWREEMVEDVDDYLDRWVAAALEFGDGERGIK